MLEKPFYFLFKTIIGIFLVLALYSCKKDDDTRPKAIWSEQTFKLLRKR